MKKKQKKIIDKYDPVIYPRLLYVCKNCTLKDLRDRFTARNGTEISDKWDPLNETFTFYDTKRQLYDEVRYQVRTRRVVNRPREDDETTINHANRMRQHLISQFQWEVIS